jgi:endonuclease YncB( thermonuclease family)
VKAAAPAKATAPTRAASPAKATAPAKGTAPAKTAAAKSREGVVARCLTGDTLQLTDRRVVHIAGIEAPNQGKRTAKDGEQYHAAKSRAMLEGIAGRRRVRVVVIGKDGRGNAIADVSLDGGQSVGEAMVRQGGAFCYPHAGLAADHQKRLLALQKDAIAARRGFWGKLLSKTQAKGTYTGDRHTKLFHPGNSPEARSIKSRNRVYFGTLMDAFLAGYGPVLPPAFWPVEKK